LDRGEFITDEFLLWQGTNMSSPALTVFLVLLSFLDWKKGTCYPPIELVSDYCGYRAPRPVYKLLDELEDSMLIKRVKTKGRRNNKYKFLTWNTKTCKLYPPKRRTINKKSEGINEITEEYFRDA